MNTIVEAFAMFLAFLAWWLGLPSQIDTGTSLQLMVMWSQHPESMKTYGCSVPWILHEFTTALILHRYWRWVVCGWMKYCFITLLMTTHQAQSQTHGPHPFEATFEFEGFSKIKFIYYYQLPSMVDFDIHIHLGIFCHILMWNYLLCDICWSQKCSKRSDQRQSSLKTHSDWQN